MITHMAFETISLGSPSDGWDFLGALVTAIASVLGTLGVVWLNRRRNAGPNVAEFGGQLVDTSGVNQGTLTVIQNVMGLYEQRITHLENEQDALRTVNLNLHGQLVVVKPALRTLTTWVDAGAEPPPPAISHEARQALEVDPREP